jgi:multiple sugar transport system substrate-binding protein
MRRTAIVTLLISAALAAALGLAACGGDDSSSSSSSEEAQTFDPNKQYDLTMWSGFTGRELDVLDGIIDQFEEQNPNVSVDSVGSVNDDKIVAALRGGNAPDVTLSFSTDNTGAFCSSGGWIDLTPYIERDKVAIDDFPQAVQDYTEYQGNRCAMPLLADDYGLYYNKDMFEAAGIKSPPKTISELDADAKKLTQQSSDGTIEVAGYVPNSGFYESVPAHYAPQWDAQWQDADGKSSLATDPEWTDYLEWDKNLIDWYGYDDLTKFLAGAGAEFSASNAFETGKLAMMLDGEYRTAFIADEHPELNYGTAPFPVADGQEDRYGAGYVTGSIIGIPRDSENQAAAWELVKYLTTDTDALVTLANQLANVPTTPAAAQSPKLDLGPEFDPFITIFKSPDTQTTPITASGSANQELFQSFVSKYEAGEVDDLPAGLQDVDEQIDAQEENASGGGEGGVP